MKIKTFFLINVLLTLIACFPIAASAVELRVGTASKCPLTGATTYTGESAFGAAVAVLAGKFVQSAATSLLNNVANYLKQTPKVTKVGYARVNSFWQVGPNLKPLPLPKISPNFRCIYVVAGNFTGADPQASMPTGFSTEVWKHLQKSGLNGEPYLYFEALLVSDNLLAPRSPVIAFQPMALFYAKHIDDSGPFSSKKRDLAITFAFLKPGQSKPFLSSLVTITDLAPDDSHVLTASVQSMQVPWIPIPKMNSEPLPFTIRVTLVETGKPNVIAKALGDALSSQTKPIASAIPGALGLPTTSSPGAQAGNSTTAGTSKSKAAASQK